MSKTVLCSVLFLVVSSNCPASCSDMDVENTGVVESIEAAATPHATANQIGLSADYALQHKNYDQAISLCQRAIALDKNDLDIHKSYALALEGKLKKEKSSDSALFNACLREWLIVLRTECGPEKLPNFHGITVPGYGRLYRDEDFEMEARMHLRALTGTTPKGWESDIAYIKRAGQKTTSTVAGKLLDKTAKPQAHASKEAVVTPATAKTQVWVDPLDWLKN